ncbi:radical SAM protein [candidate division WOR-3 bacterium]|nr:radical SAM protein [candidate division WOR-3 bacterium]
MNKYKISPYNFFFKTKNGENLAFNSISGGFALIEKENEGKVKKFIENPNKEVKSEKDKEVFDSLLKGRFIVPEHYDEIGILKIRFWNSRFITHNLGLTILPTLNCNFKCIYCYEREEGSVREEKMSNEKAEALMNFISKQLSSDIKSLSINWYGGEPLLEYGRIKNLNTKIQKLCKKKGVNYSAGMITNGYLLNSKMIKELIEMEILSFQITLDGPPEIHNKFRPLINDSPTFSKILENIKKAVKYDKIKINVRVNVSKENPSAHKELVSILEKEGLKDKVVVYLGKVTSENERMKLSCFSDIAFSEIEIEFLEYLLENNWRIYMQPLVKSIYCGAYFNKSYTIDPMLNIYKCWENAGIDIYKIGHLDRNGNMELNEKNIKWLSYDPFEIEECRNCKYLPLCMGGCLAKSMKSVFTQGKIEKGKCIATKYNLLKRLKIYFKYIQVKSTNSKEQIKNVVF